MKELTRKATDGNCLVSTLNGKFDEKQYCNTVNWERKCHICHSEEDTRFVWLQWLNFFPLGPRKSTGHKERKGLGNLELSNFQIYGLKTRVASPSCGLLDIYTKGVTKKDRHKLAWNDSQFSISPLQLISGHRPCKRHTKAPLPTLQPSPASCVAKSIIK